MKTNLLTSILLIATCFVSQNIWAYDFSTIILSCTDYGTVVINNDKEFTNDIGEVDINNDVENTFVFKPNANYQLIKVLINGEDVTSSVKNNQLTTMIPAGSKMNVVFSQMTGDVNGDGTVDISDVVKLVNIILGSSTGEEPAQEYYWYVGTTNPSKTSWSLSDLTETSTSPITSFTAPNSNGMFTIWIVPTSEWGTVSSMKVGGETRNPWQTPVPWVTSVPSGYTAYYSQYSGDTSVTDIIWTK